MASGSTYHHIDIEAQNLASQLPRDVGTSKMHEMGIRRPQAEIDSDTSQTASPVPVPADENTSFGGDAKKGTPWQSGVQAIFAGDTNIDPNLNDPPVDGGPIDGNPDRGPPEKRMIGDFDGSANPLWSLYGKKAKSHDESRIQTLKDDMDGVIIFAGLFSVALTVFIIDSKQGLKANPADQTVYYLQQNVAILSQISQQISSIVPQVAIPSTPLPPFPNFNPSASDVRVNAFWLMALIFSLSAALLATLVQQWVRDYMHVFQRYSDPLKSARIRQYLYEGSEGWYMPVVAEAVPGLFHVSLFLFFAGLGDFVLNINTTVGISTIIPISICGLFYILTTFAPVIYPQSPYQNSFSGLIWYLVQKIHGRRYKDRSSDGMLQVASPIMVEGQMQLAMEESEKRMERDARSIRWLVDKSTEDSEMELLATAIPGSFNAEWGTRVWKKVSEIIEDGDNRSRREERAAGPLLDPNLHTSMPVTLRSSRINVVRSVFGPVLRPIRARTAGSPTNIMFSLQAPHPPDTPTPGPAVIAPLQRDTSVRELCMHIAHLLETCKNRGLFVNDELWRRRTRTCVEATALLVFHANADLRWFGDIGKLLRDIGNVEKTRALSLTGMDQSFITRWTCLSITVTRSMLSRNSPLQLVARETISYLEKSPSSGVSQASPHNLAEFIDTSLVGVWPQLGFICVELFRTQILSEEWVREILRNRSNDLSSLEQLYEDCRYFKVIDPKISTAQHSVQSATHELICELPGIEFDGDRTDPLPFVPAIDKLTNPALLFLFPGWCSEGFISIYPRLKDILEGRNSEQFQEVLKSLRCFPYEKAAWEGNVLQRQLWRMQDICDGGGLGFCVEIFLIAFKQLLSTSSSMDTHSALYVSTFRELTADWNEHKHSLGTQKLLLNVIASRSGIISTFKYPTYITDELLVFVDNMLQGQIGPHIDYAMTQLRSSDPEYYHGPPDFPARALKVISSSRPSSVPPSS